jgi:replicative DNA helicase
MIAAMDSERELLGCCLLGRLDWLEVSGALSPDEWADNRHRMIVTLMDRLGADGSQWDGVSVMQSVTGPLRAYVGELMAGSRLLTKSVDWHVGAIRSASKRRRLIGECERLAQLAARETDADMVLSDAQAAMLALLDDAVTAGPVSIVQAAQEWFQELDRRLEHHGDTLGMPSGLSDLDKLTGGFEPGELIVIAGRPSHGKTTLAMNLAEHAMLREQQSVLAFSLEMSRSELVNRMAASLSRVDMHKFRQPRKMDDGEWGRLSEALASVNDKAFWIDDTPALHINQIRARARAHAQRRGLQLVIVDYLGLARGDSPKLYEAVTQISGGLKALAKELRVPVIAVAQLNREADKRGSHRPAMSDLRDSGAVEQDADKILFVWRPEIYEPDNPMVAGKAEVIVAKNRNGETGIVPLEFRGSHNRFVQPAYGYEGMS